MSAVFPEFAARRIGRVALVASLVGILAACGHEPPPAVLPPPTVAKPETPKPPAQPETPDAPFRSNAPAKSDGLRPFVAPKVTELSLKNGIKVLFVPHAVPTVSVAVVIKAGQGDVPDAKPGALSFLGAMLEQGTKSRSALKLSDDFEAIGAHHDASFGWDSGQVAMDVLAEHLDAGLELLSDVVQNPTFPKEEVERLRARRIAGLQSDKNSPTTMMLNAQAAALFGRAHPYGHSLTGEIADVNAISSAELSRLHKALFVPALTTLVVSGGVGESALLGSLERTFGTLKGAARARGAVPAPPAVKKGAKEEPRLVVVDKPRAAQSQICVTQVGVPASTADRDAITVMNAILGGMFSSRINLNLREKHAYTYGARSYFSMRRGAGPFAASAAVVTEKTAPALHELFVELEAMRSSEVTDAELQGAKEGIVQTLPARFETARDVVGAIADLVIYDWPADEYATRAERISKVTAADVKRVAQKLTPRTMKVVLVGDKTRLEPDLDALHLGPLELRDAFGNRAEEAKPEGSKGSPQAPGAPMTASGAPAKAPAAPPSAPKPPVASPKKK
jgi:zinc protease